jgi:RNA polymerase sigma-70 factor (ECF subfamily)
MATPNYFRIARQAPVATEAQDRLIAALISQRAELLRFARGCAADATDAEDMLQELCLKLLSRKYELRDPAKTTGWLKVALRNIAVDLHRRRLAERKAEDAFGEISVANADEIERPGFSICNCLDSALDKIEPRHADIITRVDVRQEPRAEIAVSAGITDGNVRIRLLRARKALRRQIERECRSCPAFDGGSCHCRADTQTDVTGTRNEGDSSPSTSRGNDNAHGRQLVVVCAER